jgi:hypothetical protein
MPRKVVILIPDSTLHRVNTAVILADAGIAIDLARGVDLGQLTVTERKVVLLIDVARAFLKWGRHEKTYIALRAAAAEYLKAEVGRVNGS